MNVRQRLKAIASVVCRYLPQKQEQGQQIFDIESLDTTPPQRKWVGLTDEERSDIYNQKDWNINYGWEYEQAIEAKLKEKNT